MEKKSTPTLSNCSLESISHFKRTYDHDGYDDDNSKIEEVRITVSNRDDPAMLYNTFRVWFLGLALTVAISFANQLLYFRRSLSPFGHSICAVVSLPLGHLLAAILPSTELSFFKWKFSLNPGPFTIKEHALIGVMASCSSIPAYAINLIGMQSVLLKVHKPLMASVVLVLTTQFVGYGMAGVLRRVLVRPPQMLWPSFLVSVALYRSLHAKQTSEDMGRTSMMKYIGWLTFTVFIYQWLPGFMFGTLGSMAILCWIKPSNILLSQITGSDGLGIGVISLDWSVVSYVQPLITPLFAQFNILVGLVLFAYILVPAAYYSNQWGGKTMPIMSHRLYTRDGSALNMENVHNQGEFDSAAYLEQGPLRMSTAYTLAYGFGFASLAATLIHVPLYHGKDLMATWKSTVSVFGKEDVHERLMKAYPEVPDWWYMSLMGLSLVLSMVTCVVWDYMPWWALLLSLFTGALFALPAGVIQALTNQVISLNIITEFIIGYILPGRPLANATFKTYGYISNYQALNFVGYLKFGHYMKIPPRMMFTILVLGTLVSSLVQVILATWLLEFQGACQPSSVSRCDSIRTFGSAAIVWGSIGTARFLGNRDGGMYSAILWMFLLGLVLPVIFYRATKRWPKIYWIQYIHWPIIFSVGTNIPPITPFIITNSLLVGFVFGYLMRKYKFRWWSRYVYATSAALDIGLMLATTIIFAGFESRKITFPHWWGNPEDYQNDHCPLASASFP